MGLLEQRTPSPPFCRGPLCRKGRKRNRRTMHRQRHHRPHQFLPVAVESILLDARTDRPWHRDEEGTRGRSHPCVSRGRIRETHLQPSRRRRLRRTHHRIGIHTEKPTHTKTWHTLSCLRCRQNPRTGLSTRRHTRSCGKSPILLLLVVKGGRNDHHPDRHHRR